MRIRLRNLKKGKKIEHFNVAALKDPAIKMRYQLEISNRFEQLITDMEENDEPERIWTAFSRSITEAAQNTIENERRN